MLLAFVALLSFSFWEDKQWWCATFREGVALQWFDTAGRLAFMVGGGQHLHFLQGVGVILSILHQGGHVLQTLFPKPSDGGDVAPTVCLHCFLLLLGERRTHSVSALFLVVNGGHCTHSVSALFLVVIGGTSHPQCLCIASCFSLHCIVLFVSLSVPYQTIAELILS